MLDEFLRRITKLKGRIDKLGDYTSKFSELYGKKLRDILDSKEEKKITEQIDLVAEIFRKESQEIKNDLENINQENIGIKEKCREDSLEYQSRNMHWQRCTKSLTSEINRFRQEQLKYAQDEKDKLESQYAVINPGATKEEISKVLSSEDGEAVLQKALAGSTESSKRQLEEAKSRNIKIRSLSKRLDELLDLINELQKMVNRSGTVVDKIEVKMAKTKTSTEGANKDLESAYRYQVNAMWIKRVFYGVVLFVLFAGLIYLLLRFAPSIINYANTRNNSRNRP